VPNTQRYKYLVQLTADLVSSYVSNNPVPPSSLQSLITDVHVSLSKLQAGFAAAFKEPLKPAVPIKNSVTGEYIVCLDDGRKFKTLRRHLAKLGMTADEYREKWGLSADYPMSAPNYSAKRSKVAKAIGFGRKAVNVKVNPTERTKASRRRPKTL